MLGEPFEIIEIPEPSAGLLVLLEVGEVNDVDFDAINDLGDSCLVTLGEIDP